MLTSNLANHGELDAETLFRSRRRLWLPSDHALLASPQISLHDVAKQPYVMLTVDEASRTAGRYWDHYGLSPQVVFSTSSVEAVRSMVAAGMGVTILSDMVYRPWSLEGQRIEQRVMVEPVPSMDVGLTWARMRPFPAPRRCSAPSSRSRSAPGADPIAMGPRDCPGFRSASDTSCHGNCASPR